MNRTIEDIQKDIELLGIKGGYDIEQLLTPQDCRRLSYEIERLNNIIKEVKEYIKDNAYWGEETEDGDFVSGKLLHDDDITYIEEILNKGE